MKALPKEFSEQMQSRLGITFGQFVNALELPSPVSIRINPKKSKTVTGDNVPWSDSGRYLQTRPVFTLDPLLHAGAYYVQEASSMFVEQAVLQHTPLDQPLSILDLCAAPGGKSTHLLSLINDKSLLVSNEVIRTRASILSENIQKWGYANVMVTNNDPQDFQSLPGLFDVIVIDAPCSGEGLFRKDPEAMEEWSPQNVVLCQGRQRRIVSDVWPALKENGVLIYCTCTYNELENEENLAWLTTQHEVEFLKIKTESSWGIEESQSGSILGYRFYPHRVKGEGFFLSCIRKKERAETVKIKVRSKETSPSKKVIERIGSWLLDQDNFRFYQHKDLVYAFGDEIADKLEFLNANMKVVHAGIPIASMKHEKAIPEHALALSTYLNIEAMAKKDLDYDDAVRYLRKDSIVLPELSTGYTLMTFQNIALGWSNVLSNRVNNMYPSEWRIRMAPQTQGTFYNQNPSPLP